MYGRVDPGPETPSYSPAEVAAMAAADAQRRAAEAAMTLEDRAWAAIAVPPGLGADCGRRALHAGQGGAKNPSLPAPETQIRAAAARLPPGPATRPPAASSGARACRTWRCLCA